MIIFKNAGQVFTVMIHDNMQSHLQRGLCFKDLYTGPANWVPSTEGVS